jgi:predicted permease
MFRILRRRRFEQEMADELRAHMEHRADDLVAKGMSRPEAERQARIELGTIESHKEAIRDERPLGRTRRFFEQTTNDLHLGARRLIRAPLYALFAIGSIGVGVGMTTAMFALVQETFWPEVGIHEMDDVVLLANQIEQTAQIQWDRTMSVEDFADYRRAQTSLAGAVAATKFSQSLVLPIGAQLVSAEGVTDGYFQILGVRATLGRVLQPSDGEPGAPAVMVLSDQLWRRGFAADSAVVGQTVRFGGVPFEIVGVAAREYRGLNARMPRMTALWIPQSAQSRLPVYGASADPIAPRRDRVLTVAGRLKPGVAPSQADAEALAVSAALDASFPVTAARFNGKQAIRVPAKRQWLARPLADSNLQSSYIPAILVGIVAMVLLVACTNLANLSIARGTSREAELAVRLALGASRGRLVRELFADSAIVGLAGFVVALLISVPLMGMATSEAPMFSGNSGGLDPHLSVPVFMAAATMVILALMVSGLWPAWRLSRTDVRSTMNKGSAIVSPSWKTERLLIRVQMVVSVALFCVSAGFISVLLAQRGYEPGIDLDRITVARTVFRLQTWHEARSQEAITAIAAVAPSRFGFTDTALSSSMPFGSNVEVYASVATSAADLSPSNMTLLMASTPGIFDALGIPIVTGRAFDRRDIADTDPVVVLSQASALELFGATDVVGREVFMRGTLNALDSKKVERRTVIGVTRDTAVGSLSRRGDGIAYVPLAQRYEPPNFVVGRSDSGDGDMRALIRAGDPDVAVDAIGSGLTMLGGSWNAFRVVAGVAFVLGGMTLVLTMAGLFGVLSALVSRRTREIGIRKALGADNHAIRRLIFRDGSRPVASGSAIGLFLGVIGGFLIRASIPSGAPPLTLVAVALVAVTVIPATLVACYLPARRAMRVDPNVTLKDV